MKTLSILEKISELGDSTKILQSEISVAEVSHLFQHLHMRYVVLETTNILRNFVKSSELGLVLDTGTKVLLDQVDKLEKLIKEYGIPLPDKPPVDSKTIVKAEAITDKYIFRRIFRGIQSFISSHSSAFIQSYSPKLREEFKKMLLEELNIYDEFIEFGKIKGYLLVPPMYKK